MSSSVCCCCQRCCRKSQVQAWRCCPDGETREERRGKKERKKEERTTVRLIFVVSRIPLPPSDPLLPNPTYSNKRDLHSFMIVMWHADELANNSKCLLLNVSWYILQQRTVKQSINFPRKRWDQHVTAGKIQGKEVASCTEGKE